MLGLNATAYGLISGQIGLDCVFMPQQYMSPLNVHVVVQ